MTTNSSFKERNVAPHLALVAVQIMFGSWAIFGKIVLNSMSSASLVGFRICGAAIIFTIFQRKLTELRQLPKRVLAWLVLSSLLGIVVNQLLFVRVIAYHCYQRYTPQYDDSCIRAGPQHRSGA